MRLKLNKENYIGGYGCFGNPDYLEYEWQNPPEKLTDKYNRPLYKWDGEKPIYSPQPYTPEQTEQLRKEYVRAEIEKAYPQDIQLKIMMEQSEKPEAYEQMQTDRANIKTESHKIDFQIAEEV